MPSRVSELITAPARFDATLLTKPARPAPNTKNDAQAINVTHTGTGKTVAVSHVSTTASTPMLTV
jgi:hypothetical protein